LACRQIPLKQLIPLIAAVLVFPIHAAQMTRIGVVTHPALGEMSGIVASSYPDVYWVHNDSGDEARIFAIHSNGEVVLPNWANTTAEEWGGYAIDNAWQYDWEDIALADGVLYLADIGNNDNARRDLGVYVVMEPHPVFVVKTRAVKFLPIRFPDQTQYPAEQWHFDSEAIFSFNEKLYFLSKHRQPGIPISFEPGAKLYRLDTSYIDRDNVLKLVDRHDRVTMVTGADVSPDAQHLAIVTYTHLWVFDRPRRGDKWLQSRARVLELDRDFVKQNEAIAWESNDSLLMTNENREIFRIPLSAIPYEP
jgi:hypothetical protein